MVTGDEDFLEVAERGTEYLRDHMRFVDRDEDVVYWYHGVDLRDGTEKKLYASEFGDDYDAIAMYEQIYALAGPTQLYRLTGDQRIASDIDGTLRLFEKFFRDDEQGGYYSHIDPIQLSPHHESLGRNRSRKNWNSVGDHAPAYLFNLYLATGEERHAEMLEDTFDTISRALPGLRQPVRARAVLRRLVARPRMGLAAGPRGGRSQPEDRLEPHADDGDPVQAVATPSWPSSIARTMPAVGSDLQRGGWYDMVERTLLGEPATAPLHLARPQDVVAAGAGHPRLPDPGGPHRRRRVHPRRPGRLRRSTTRSSSTTTRAACTSTSSPTAPRTCCGTERLKGSHSMSMYHTAELCYLATVYQRLLLHGEPLTLWFRPRPDGFPDRMLRVAPDAAAAGEGPPGLGGDRRQAVLGVRRGRDDGEAAGHRIHGHGPRAPRSQSTTNKGRTMRLNSHKRGELTVITLDGSLDSGTASSVQTDLEQLIPQAGTTVLDLGRMTYMSSAGLRVLLLIHRRAQAERGTDRTHQAFPRRARGDERDRLPRLLRGRGLREHAACGAGRTDGGSRRAHRATRSSASTPIPRTASGNTRCGPAACCLSARPPVPGGVNFSVYSNHATGCHARLVPPRRAGPDRGTAVSAIVPHRRCVRDDRVRRGRRDDRVRLPGGGTQRGESPVRPVDESSSTRTRSSSAAGTSGARPPSRTPPTAPASGTTISTGRMTGRSTSRQRIWSSTSCTCADSPGTPRPGCVIPARSPDSPRRSPTSAASA